MSDIYEAELLTEVVKGSGGVELLPATSTRLGGIKVGTNLTITEDGILSASASGGGVTAEVKTALLNCFANVAWINENGQAYYNALQTALNNAGTSSGGGSSSGGDSGSGGNDTPPEDLPDATAWTDGVPYEISYILGGAVNKTTGEFYKPSSQEWARTDYMPCQGVSYLSWHMLQYPDIYPSAYNAFYDINKNYIGGFTMNGGYYTFFQADVPANAAYFAISNYATELDRLILTPYA